MNISNVRRVSGPLLLALAAAGTIVAATAGPQDAPQPGHSGRPLRVVIAQGPGRRPLTEFQKHLEQHYHVTCRWIVAEKGKPFGDLEPLKQCDVILTNLYRTSATSEQLKQLKKYFRSKPVVGMRRAHHGFQNWLEADREVFGVDYRGHYFGPNVTMVIAEKHKDSPILKGVLSSLRDRDAPANRRCRLPDGGLYQHLDVAEDVTVYMVGGPEGKPLLPQTWSRIVQGRGQRVFYTRYGPEDLADKGVRDMVIRALFWAAARDAGQMKKTAK